MRRSRPAAPPKPTDDDELVDPWKVRFELREWQQIALERWVNARHKGVIEAATGTGKTAVALAAIELLHKQHPDHLRVAIVVPTKVLARQWKEQIITGLGVKAERIGELHSDAPIRWKGHQEVLITVVNSARTQLAQILDEWKRHGRHTLLVVDECHRLGSDHNSRVFDGDFEWSIGLSATPERPDNGHTEYIYPALGNPVFRYPLLRALDEGVLAPVISVDLYVDFTSSEHALWGDLGKEISTSLRALHAEYPELDTATTAELFDFVNRRAKDNHPGAMRLLKLISDRRTLVATAKQRIGCQRALLDWLAATGKRALVFHETIETAEASADWLRRADVNASLDHSNLPKDKRQRAISSFRSGRSQVLVAVRALDEGIDVPEASVAIIAAGSRTRRQRIQRIGRVLRRVEGKQALVVTILVRDTPEESEVGGSDIALLGASRVRHHRWPERPLGEALDEQPSTYSPPRAKPTEADRVTFLDSSKEGHERQRLARPPTRIALPNMGQFAINGWHDAAEVQAAITIPAGDFTRIHRQVRKAFRRSLGSNANDLSKVHGSEIAAIAREYHRGAAGPNGA